MLSRYLALDDFDPAAKRILPRCIYGYIAGGSETCTTLNGNRTAFDSYRFVPRVLTDTSVRSQQTELFGRSIAAPFGIAPMGAINIAARGGDIALAVAAESAGNRAVGGAPASKHMQATAFDIAMSNHDPVAFEAAARAVGFLGFGYYPRSGFMHIDLGPGRSWGEPFPVRATPFVSEIPPAREVLADSRTLKGGGAAGIATVGAAGVEVAQEVLAETQSAILPFVPYLDTLRWVFIAVALIGIAVAIHARIDDWKRGQR